MSYCREEGKDQIMFVTKEDYNRPSTAVVKDIDEDEEPGLILPNGEINWQCPCLGGMASGPCGVEFREAFSCFHYSKSEPKGSDCYEPFRVMQDCMSKFPDLYDPSDDKEKNSTPEQSDESVAPPSDSTSNNTDDSASVTAPETSTKS